MGGELLRTVLGPNGLDPRRCLVPSLAGSIAVKNDLFQFLFRRLTDGTELGHGLLSFPAIQFRMPIEIVHDVLARTPLEVFH